MKKRGKILAIGGKPLTITNYLKSSPLVKVEVEEILAQKSIEKIKEDFKKTLELVKEIK